jgi:hypothetical protein
MAYYNEVVYTSSLECGHYKQHQDIRHMEQFLEFGHGAIIEIWKGFLTVYDNDVINVVFKENTVEFCLSELQG